MGGRNLTAATVLARARAAGLVVEAAGGNLRLRAAAEPPAEILADLRQNKPEVLALLAAPADDPSRPLLPPAPVVVGGMPSCLPPAEPAQCEKLAVRRLRNAPAPLGASDPPLARADDQVPPTEQATPFWVDPADLPAFVSVQVLSPTGRGAPLPADAARLLRHIRDTLHCRLALEGDRVKIWPTHRCPPNVVAAAQSVAGELRAILGAGNEAPDAARLPTEAEVEALAEALAANPAHRITDRDIAMRYFRATARNRLHRSG